jgi:serine/threonine protein kinase
MQVSVHPNQLDGLLVGRAMQGQAFPLLGARTPYLYNRPKRRTSADCCETVADSSVVGVAAAIRIYYPGQMQKRIDREITALQKIDCSSIVRLLWTGTIVSPFGHLTVVATTLVPGMPLTQVIAMGRISHDQIGVIIFDVVRAIKEMWDLRIFHRDLNWTLSIGAGQGV